MLCGDGSNINKHKPKVYPLLSNDKTTKDSYWLLLVIILVAIDGYSIPNYNRQWLLVHILLVDGRFNQLLYI
jgi:hypothetical protein